MRRIVAARHEGTEHEVGTVGVRLWLGCVLAVIGVALYVHTLDAPFIFDDTAAIVDNASIRGWNPTQVLAPPRDTPTAGRPVVNLSLAANYALGGLDVRGYHAVNIAIHVCCALLLYGIVRRTLSPPCSVPSCLSPDAIGFLSALLWLVHPLQTECVTYVTQRTESIMALFFLLTVYAAIRADGSPRRGWWSTAAIAACALGMASKESMVTAPLLVILYDWAYRKEPWSAVFRRRRGLYTGLLATWVILLALMVTGPRAGSVGFGHGVTAWEYGLNQCVVIVGYLGRVMWPAGLLLDYGFPRALTLREAAPFVAVVIALVALTAVLLVRRPRLGYPAAWFLIVLAPTSSVIPIATEVAADRRVYLALAGLAVLVVTVGDRFFFRLGKINLSPVFTSPVSLVCIAAVASLACVTWQRASLYRHPEVLWQQSVAAVPGNHRALTNLATALAARGRYDQAATRLRQALGIAPDSTTAGDNLDALLASGRGGDR